MTVDEFLRDEIEAATTPEDPWTNRRYLKAEARKEGYTSNQVDGALERMANEGEVLAWHGLHALGTEDAVQAVLDHEFNRREITRGLLVKKANRLKYDHNGEDDNE